MLKFENPEQEEAWHVYTAWARQFARDYASACRDNPRYRLCEHTHDFDEIQEAYDLLRDEMQMTHSQFAHWRG